MHVFEHPYGGGGNCGGEGGEGGGEGGKGGEGGGMIRAPQSAQSVPKAHQLYSALGPPSSQKPLLA